MLSLFKNTTVKNLLTLVSGTVFAQVLPLLVMPLLTRLFDPQGFGAFSVFVGIAGIISVAASLRFELAIPQAEDNLAAKNLFILSCITLIILTCLFIISVVAFPTQLLGVFKFQGTLSILPLYLLVVCFFCSGFTQVSINRSIRLSNFSEIAVGKILISGGYAISQLLLGYFSISGGLVFGYVAGQVLGAVFFLKRSASWLLSGLDQSRVTALKISARDYKDLPLFSAPSAIADAYCSTLPVLVVAANYDLATAGMFGLANRVLGAPAALISLSVSQVIFQKVASTDGSKPGFIRRILFRSILGLASIIIPFALVIFFFGPDLFAVFFGEQWRLAGSYAGIMIIGIAVQFLASPNSLILTLKENIKIGSAWQVLRLITLSWVLFVARDYDFESFLWLFIAHEVVIYTLYMVLIFVGARRRVGNVSDR